MNLNKNMKLHSIILFCTIIIAQNINSQSITLNCYYIDFDEEYYSAKLIFSPIHSDGWKLDLKIDSPKKGFFITPPEDIQIQFPISGTKIDISEKELVLSNNRNQQLVLYVEESLFSSSTISGYIHLKEGWDYYIDNIKIPYKVSNTIDGFHKLVKQISKPYTQKSTTCNKSIIRLINNPSGIDRGYSWYTPYDKFLSVAEHFYGNYDSSPDSFIEKIQSLHPIL